MQDWCHTYAQDCMNGATQNDNSNPTKKHIFGAIDCFHVFMQEGLKTETSFENFPNTLCNLNEKNHMGDSQAAFCLLRIFA